MRPRPRVLFRGFTYIPAIRFTCHSYILIRHNQIYLASVLQQYAFHFILKIGHALNRSLVHRRTIHGNSFYFEEERREYRNGGARANKILLAHGDANTVSQADV